MNNRPLSVAHLVFGLIFLGAAGLWLIGEGTDADAGDIARLVPAVLIGAGVIGLVAIMVNARNGRLAAQIPTASSPAEPATEPDTVDTETADPEYADTAVLDGGNADVSAHPAANRRIASPRGIPMRNIPSGSSLP